MSWNKDNLEKAFAKVKLTLVFAKESFARGVNSEDIFGLDIRRAKPGRADELVVWNFAIPGPVTGDEASPLIGRTMQRTPQPQGRNAIYVRGAVKHLDHETVKFNQWRKVIANTESGISVSVGGGWVD